MMLSQKAFWAVVFFLSGVLLRSAVAVTDNRILILLGVLVVLAIALSGRYWLAVCSVAFIAGGMYYHVRVPEISVHTFSGAAEYRGVVERVKIFEDRQTLIVAIYEPYRHYVYVTAQRYPAYAYGDEVVMLGTLSPFESDDARLLRDRAIGSFRFPEIRLTGRDEGNRFRALLYDLRDRIAASFQRALPSEQATFMTGLTLGKSAAFSQELQEQMKITGTTHMVALSGTNVTIIVQGVMMLFGLWFSRRALFPLTVTAITLFVLMTGAEASVVRAAIMAGIVLLAERTGRAHATANAIAFAALLMVLHNPAILVFDIGFQLSFFALLGIVYLQPVIEYWFSTRKIRLGLVRVIVTTLCATAAAQLAVFPLSLMYFGFASVISILPNLLILLLIPYTMLGGLFIFIASLFSGYLALLVALPSRFLLAYELGVIHFFARFKVGIETDSFPPTLVVTYYALLIVLIVRTIRRERIVIE